MVQTLTIMELFITIVKTDSIGDSWLSRMTRNEVAMNGSVVVVLLPIL